MQKFVPVYGWKKTVMGGCGIGIVWWSPVDTPENNFSDVEIFTPLPFPADFSGSIILTKNPHPEGVPTNDEGDE